MNTPANKGKRNPAKPTLNSPMLLRAAVAAVCLGAAGSLHAVPPPPAINVPDGGSTATLLGAAIGGLALLNWRKKR